MTNYRILAALVLLTAAAAYLGATEPEQTPDPATAAKIAPPIRPNFQVFKGALSEKDARDKIYDFAYHKAHALKLKAGLTYMIEMRSPEIGQPLVRVEDKHGKPLEPDDGKTGPRFVFSPKADDEYRIIATTVAAGQKGFYTLAVAHFPADEAQAIFQSPFHAPESVQFGDIVITVLSNASEDAKAGARPRLEDTRHGYREFRFEIQNRSAKVPHHIALLVPRESIVRHHDHGLRSIKKSVEVAAGGTVQVSLFRPSLPLWVDEVGVVIDGKLQEQSLSLAMRASDSGEISRVFPHILVGRDIYEPIDKQLGTFYHSRRIESFSLDNGPIADSPLLTYRADRMELTTRSWLGFSCYDGVFLSPRQLTTLPAETRLALFQYVECGGTLVTMSGAKLPDSWRLVGETKGLKSASPGFGRCLVFDTDPGKWTKDDLRAIHLAVRDSSSAWNQVASVTDANRLFPVVENAGIPVRGLFLFMMVFVVLIGPLNILWLSRVKRRLWLLWTVPVFSLLTTGALFLYVGITDGWYPHFRGLAITVLDENSQRASSIGWLGYYSPTSSSSLHFSTETELSPCMQSDERHFRFGRFRHEETRHQRNLSIDWTTDQHLEPGWISAKVPLHFLARRTEKRLERLSVRREGEHLIIVNGLKADIKTLKLADKDGIVYTGGNIPAGAEVKLTQTKETAAVANTLHHHFGRSWLALAADVDGGRMEVQPGTYLATFDEMPFLEDGLSRAQSRKSRAIVFGVMKDAP